MAPRRPNIVIFNPDQWRGDVLGHLGNPAAVTPHLDRLVQTEGVSFRHAFCQNPVCTPSRCSYMSGWYPHVRGHRTMVHMLRKTDPMLLRTLKENGYFVWWGGKNDLVPGQHGYDGCCDEKYVPEHPPKPMYTIDRQAEWRGPPDGDRFYSFYVGRLDTQGEPFYADRDWANVLGAIDFIQRAPRDRPFCLYLPLTYPHPPFAVEEPFYSAVNRAALPPRIPAPKDWAGKPSILKGLYELQNMQGWDEECWTELRATYYGMCARVDHQFGLVVQALRQAGLYANTALLFFSDHGEFAGDYGLVEKNQNTFEDCLTRVPLLIKPPAWLPVQPRIADALVELIDVPATIEAMTGIQPGHTHFGRSLLPVLAGDTDVHRDAVFSEGGRLPGEWHCVPIQIASQMEGGLYWPRVKLQRSTGPEHTKAVMCRTLRHKYVRRLQERDELYDLEADPGELHNRIDDPTLTGELAQLKERLLTFYLETADVVPHDTDRRG
jgi:arylsulfatase A-like enzyme